VKFLSVRKDRDGSFDPSQCSGEVKLLLNRWNDIEQELGEHSAQPEVEIPPALFAKRIDGKTVWSGSDLEAVQHSLLETLAEHRSQRTSDAMAKLVIWASIQCPEPTSEAHLPPADLLVLSALKDLLRLGV
jgi:hypothetical protein